MSSKGHESNRLLDLRKVVILLVGLAMATGTATVAHLRVKGQANAIALLGQGMLIEQALGLDTPPSNSLADLKPEDLKDRPELKPFVDGLSDRILPSAPCESGDHNVIANDPTGAQGWPLASRRPAYKISCLWFCEGEDRMRRTILYADRNGLDPFSLLGFLGNVFIHAIPLTLLVAGLAWWVRSWRAKRRARRRGFPIVPLDGEA